ncbi:uncharacterized protein TNCV_2026311 [Trichonephila clavipes]|nr:uncharacterized protein TNCV_2026311 [Trichonephila clavipes]
MLNDDEIVTSVQEESNPVDDKTDEDEDNSSESSKGPSNADAFSALQTAMERYEQQSKCCPKILLFKRVKDLAAKTQKSTTVQRKISDYCPQQSFIFESGSQLETCVKKVRIVRAQMPVSRAENGRKITLYGAALKRDTSFRGMY